MKISVSGQKMEVGEALSSHVEERLNSITHKFMEHPISAHVSFTKDRYLFRCMIEVNEGVGKLPMLRASSHSDDVYSSFDEALSRIEKQLRKYKSKMKDYHQRQRIAEKEVSAMLEGTKRIIAAQPEDDPSADNPVIVAEKSNRIMTMSVGDAVMVMDLQELPALMFKNIKTGKLNVVYRRADGNISWVDPGQ